MSKLDRMWANKWINWFDKRPWDAWRPPKMVSWVLKDLKKAWYVETNAEEIKAVYLTLVQLSHEELIEKISDRKSPILVKVIWESIDDWKGFEVIEKMFDRSLGKATQKIENREVDWEGNDKVQVVEHIVKHEDI